MGQNEKKIVDILELQMIYKVSFFSVGLLEDILLFVVRGVNFL